MRIGFYPGSFDPPTYGHRDIVEQALRLVDLLVVGIGTHAVKSPLFDVKERSRMIMAMTGQIRDAPARIQIDTFSGLAVDAARHHGAGIIIRGIRGSSDYDDEAMLAGMNRVIAPDIVTIWLPASAPTRALSSSLVRQIAHMGGDVAHFVPAAVAVALRERYCDSEGRDA